MSAPQQIAVARALQLLLWAMVAYSLCYAAVYGYRVVTHDNIIGADFQVFWHASDYLLQGHAAFAYRLASDTIGYFLTNGHLPDPYDNPFPYPPVYFFLIAPLALVPLPVAYAIWSLLGVAAFGFILSRPACHKAFLGVELSQHRTYLLLSLASLYVVMCLLVGQNGLFTASLLLAGLIWRHEKPMLAGVCFGLLCFKPQLALIIPLVLLIEKNYRCFVAAALTVAALVAASLLTFGVALWAEFFEHGRMFVELLAADLPQQSRGIVSLLNSFRKAGLPFEQAQWLHVALVVPLAALVLLRLRAVPLGPERNAVIVLLSALLPPYLMTHDLVALWPVIGFIALRLMYGLRPRDVFVLFLLLFLPELTRPLALHGIVYAPWLFAGLIVWLVRQGTPAV